jgi:hypothetical protein
MSTTNEAAPWALGEIETLMHDLHGTVGLLGHMAHSPNHVEPAELVQVRERLDELTSQLDAEWQKAWDQTVAQDRAQRAALAAAEARKASPGSVADIEFARSLWGLLRGAAGATIEKCDEAEDRDRAQKPSAKARRRR